ncbi:MAG: metal ABC transporter permease [Chloroflexi bacterium]|nr:metal ABC transporter permease [Chloroflexota bacterium]
MPEVFQYSFMLRALVAGLVVGLVAPLIGTFLVLRRFAFFADTLAHTALLGVALGVLMNVLPSLAALVVCTLAAIAVEQLRVRRRLPSDAMLALFLSGSLALALVVISIARGFNVNILSYLFGSITTVQDADLWVTLVLGGLALLLVLALNKELLYISFDEESARVSGLPVSSINLITVVIAAATVALAMKIVGTLLVGALMVIPVLAAFQVARSFKSAMVLAVTFSLVSVVAGLVSSFYLNIVAGGAIVLVALLIFGGSFAFHRR